MKGLFIYLFILVPDRLLACCRIEREKFYHGQGLEPGSLTLCPSALTTELSRLSTDP